MKTLHHFAALVLAFALLTGCHVTSPKDEAFQKDWDESMAEAREDLEDAMEEAGRAWEDWDAWDEDGADRAKKHRWEIQDAAGEALYTIDSEAGVAALDELLSDNDESSWARTDEDPGEAAYSYVYCQEKTLLAGQDPEAEREYEALMRFTVSEEKDIVTMTILEKLEEITRIPGLEDILTFTVSIPAETAEALRDPAQFAE